MSDREPDHTYSEKEYCIIAGEDEFEPVDIAGYGHTIYRRKQDEIQVRPKNLEWPHAEHLYHFHHANLLYPLKEEWRAHLVKSSELFVDAKPVIFPFPDSAKSNELNVSAGQLGAVLILIFGMFMIVSVLTHQWLIHPLAGWIGIIFGITFALMGRLQQSLNAKN